MKISSPSFKHNEKIPKKYTCQGEDISPPLKFEDVPNDAKSLVLIMDDPDAPKETFVHWVMFDIPVDKNELIEDSSFGKQGINSSGQIGYMGPCPPSGMHRYFFKLYALDIILNLKKDSEKKDLEEIMKGHILAQAEMIGLCSKD
jgi:Raf kinase inhibitor-like YbhB/YbcL family protein